MSAVQSTESTEEQIDLEAVYKLLASNPWYQSREKTLLLNKFANLLGQKSSFAHKVHKQFNSLANYPEDKG